MPRFFTNEASFNDLEVSGSTIMSASNSVLTTRIIGSGSNILVVSGSTGGMLTVTDTINPSIFSVSSGSNTILDVSSIAPYLFSVATASNTILAVDSTRQVIMNVSGSGTTGIRMLGIPQQTASFILTYVSESGVVGYTTGSFTSSYALGSTISITSSYPIAVTGSTIYSTGPLSTTTPNTISSIFLGSGSGFNTANANNSNFLGQFAGFSATNASHSNLFGYKTGYISSSTSIGPNNIIIGTNITLDGGRRDSINIGGILFGTGSYSTITDLNTSSFSGSAGGRIGINIPNPLYNLHASGTISFPNLPTGSGSFIVTFDTASGQLFYTSSNTFNVTTALSSSYPIWVSGSTIYSTGPLSTSIPNTTQSIFLGTSAGALATASAYSTLIGYKAGYITGSNSASILSNNIIIGTNITLPVGRQDSINIGGIIFGTGSYSTITGLNTSSFSGSAGGRIGINVPNPLYNLHVSGTVGFPNLPTGSTSSPFIVTFDTASGQLFYTSSNGLTVTNIQGGQTNYHTIWNSPTTISSSRVVFENNSEVGIGFPTSSIGSTNRRLNIDGTTYIESGSLQFSRFGKNQIIITNRLGQAGGTSTGSGDNLIAIGSNAANALTTGGENLIAIGVGAGNGQTTGGGSSVHIGRNSGGGITTGNNNTMIGMGDQTNIPTNTSNTIHIIAGGGYQFNNAASLLGAPDNILTSGYAFIGGGFDATKYVNNLYLGAGPFVPDAQSANLNIYSPSGTGSNIVGSNFTINAGRGTGTGSAGDIFFATSTTGSTGTTLQTLSNRMVVKGTTGNVGIGTNTPQYRLDVPNNTVRINTTLFDTGDVYSARIFNGSTIQYQGNSPVVQHFFGNRIGSGFGSVSSSVVTIKAYDTGNTGAANTAILRLLGDNGVETTTFLSNGNVGIGISTPSYKLEVSGSGISGSLDVADVLYVSGSNVGVNIARPTSNLHVAGTTTLSSSANLTTLTVLGSGSALDNNAANPIVYVTASRGDIMTVWDRMSGSLFEVNQSSGDPVLQVNSDNVVKMGIWPMMGNYTSYRSTIPSGSTVTIYSIPTSSFNAAFFDYVIISGSNLRAGNIRAVWQASSVKYIETSTDDIGDTRPVTMSADISGLNFRLRGQANRGNWEIRTIIRYI